MALPAEDLYDDTWYEDQLWCPEPEIPYKEEPLLAAKALKAVEAIPSMTPSQFTEKAFMMPTDEGDSLEYFTFKGRRHLRRIYDTPSRRVLLCCGRQVEKSTLLGNKCLCYMCLVPLMRILYVSPSATQTKTFSNDRIKE